MSAPNKTRITSPGAPRIVIDATPLQSEHRSRGVGSYARHLIGALERSGTCLPRYVASTIGRHHVAEILPSDRTTYVPRPHVPAQVYWMYNELALRAAMLRLRPDVFLATDFNGLVANPTGKTVAVLHDLTALKLSRTAVRPNGRDISTRLSDLRWRRYESKLRRRTDRVLAISHSTKRDAIELLGLPQESIDVVHLGVDHDIFRPSRGRGAFKASKPYLLNVGARGDNKNQGRLLEAFALVAKDTPELELWFAGPWHAADTEWLLRESRRLGLEGRATHIGFVPTSDLASLYGNCEAFVFPSLAEGFGLPVLEAMASGAAVVTSNRSSLPEVAGDAGVLVDPTDVGAIAQGIGLLLEDRSETDRRRIAGARWATSFSWDATASGTITALLETMRGA